DGGRPVHSFTVLNTAGAAAVTLNIHSANASVIVGDAGHSLDGTDGLTVNGATGTTLLLDDEAVNRIIHDEGVQYAYQSDPGYPSYQITGQGVTRQNHGTLKVSASGTVFGQQVYALTNNIMYSNLAGLTVKGGSAGSSFRLGDASHPLRSSLPSQL